MRQENSKPANGCGCLVLLMCIGVIGAMIALPSFLSMATKAKQSQGKQHVSSMNKGQQAYYAEKSAFTNSIDALSIAIKAETEYYKYSIRATEKAAFHYGVSKHNVKSYVGGVFVVPAKKVDANAAKDEITTTSILCEADDRSTIKPPEPTYQNGKIACGKGTTQVTR